MSGVSVGAMMIADAGGGVKGDVGGLCGGSSSLPVGLAVEDEFVGGGLQP